MKKVSILIVLSAVFVLDAYGAGFSTSLPNRVSDATGLPDDIGNAQLLWEVRLGAHQYSIATIDDGKIYVGTNDNSLEHPAVHGTGGGVLRCLDQASGRMIWQFAVPRFYKSKNPPHTFNHWDCGICSAPAIDGDRLYIVSNRGDVLCLDKDGQANGNAGPFVDELKYMNVAEDSDYKLTDIDGDIVWRFDMLGLGVYPHDVCGSSVLIEGDYIYACTSNGVDGTHDATTNKQAPSLIVLDKRSGKLVATDDEKIGTRLMHGQWSSPTVAKVKGKTLILFAAGDGILYAFEPVSKSTDKVQTLKKVWQSDCNPKEYRLSADGSAIGYSGWKHRADVSPNPVIGVPVTYDGKIYIAGGQSPISGAGRGALSCFDALTGEVVWRSKLVDRTLCTVSITGGLLFIADYSGRVHCFDAASGKRYWQHQMERGTWCCSTLVADGKVYVANEDNMLYVLRAAKQKEVISTHQFKSMPITMKAADGTLYVPTQKRLLAYKKIRRKVTAGEFHRFSVAIYPDRWIMYQSF